MIRTTFAIGDLVYHRADDEGIRGVVTGVLVREYGVLYVISWGDTRKETEHYETELSDGNNPNWFTPSDN